MSDRTPVPDPDLQPASDDPAPVVARTPQPEPSPETSPATAPAVASETAPATLPATIPPAQPPTTTTVRKTSERPRRILTRGRIIAAVVLLAIIAITLRLLRGTPLSVEVAQVTRGPLQVTVDADAVTRVRSRFTITAPVAGLVSRITYSEGDSVNAGDVVAVIAPPPTDPTARGVAQAALRAAEAARSNASANLARATTSLAQAERDAARTRTLAAAGALANRDVELAQLQVDGRRSDVAAARAQVNSADAEFAQARASLLSTTGASQATTTVRTPAAGRILLIPERSERVVTPGTPLVEVGDPSSLEIAADVLSSDAASIRPGQSVTLRGWGGAPLYGSVRRVEPSARKRISALGVEEQRLSVIIDLATHPAALGDGYRLESSIVVWQAPRVLTVPASALFRNDERWQLYTLQDGRARLRDVNIGHTGSGSAEVLSGVAERDTVIVFPSEALRDGTRVRARSR